MALPSPENPFALHENDRVAAFIDGDATYSMHRGLGFDLDYRALFREMQQRSRLHAVSYYNMVPEGEAPALSRLLDWLDFNGARTVVKALRYEVDAERRKRVRSTVKVEVGVDMILSVSQPDPAHNADVILLFAADGDLAHAIERAQDRGARVVVCGSKERTDPVVDEDLRRRADLFVDMAALRPRFALAPPQRR